jgi:hypothetical protein
MKGFHPWLAHWVRHAGTRNFCPAFADLVGPLQNIFSMHCKLFQFICPHRPASWAVSRAALSF